ncbi:MAG: response regulator [Chloroflexi bacterium]|nr:response regulator [Chloroflexota bacterium]MCI0645083.1 response regulator [Chloroflexota bacterium]MCI0731918.1 response regulator [Chloroflexota bacterium]
MMEFISRLLDVPSTDPDEARRGRLLNILLFSTALITLFGLIVTFVYDVLGLEPEAAILYQGGFVMLVGLAVIYLINRYWLGWVASSLFLLLFTAVLAFDAPEEVIQGRSLFMFAIPILMASVLLRSYGSFIIAAVIAILHTTIAITNDFVPNIVGSLAFFVIALISWLSARSSERAVEDVRRINQELDVRVNERTQDLAVALAREHAESSRNEAILDGIADGVIVIDNYEKAIIANPAISRLMEISADDIVGRHVSQLMAEKVNEEDQHLILALLKEKELARPPLKIGWGNRTLSVSFAPFLAGYEEAGGMVAVFRDFTREAEIDRMKSDFVSIASHELRTPLTSIKGYIDLVLQGSAGQVNQQQASFLQIAKNNTDRLHELVRDLLDLSRIESGKIELEVQLVSMADLITTAASVVQKQFEERGLTLSLNVPPDLPRVFGDPNRITQILINLFSNAYKYTPSGGAVVRARVIKKTLEVDITDTGLGISPEDQQKLFTRFFRADDPAVRQQAGTGLGLNITRSLIEMHGGEIWLKSKLGEGTTVGFTLPLPEGVVKVGRALRKGPAELAPVRALHKESSTATVLVVDDDPQIAQLFEHHLTQAGYQVHVVTKSHEVIGAVHRLQPDLVTLDLLMEIDGLSILDQLKSDAATAETPVVIISVVPDPGKGLTLGAADYLTKPVREEELLGSVRRVLLSADGQTNGKVLVVDDDKDIVNWLKHALSYHGFDVTTAYDGYQALEAVATDIPDLILLDMLMPRMDGRTTIYRLREQEHSRHIPVIVLSANPPSDEGERIQLLGAGVREFLKKPIAIEEVVAEVARHLNQPAA